MEHLIPPPLQFARELHWRLLSGQSMRESMRLCLESSPSSFAALLGEWWGQYLRDVTSAPNLKLFPTRHQEALIDLILRGACCQPTTEALAALCLEMETAAAAELEEHIGKLPFKLLIPLLLFYFPAFLILLLGPLLRELQQQMGV